VGLLSLPESPSEDVSPKTQNRLNSHSTLPWAMELENYASTGCSDSGTLVKQRART
jgi:hypothetical protein